MDNMILCNDEHRLLGPATRDDAESVGHGFPVARLLNVTANLYEVVTLCPALAGLRTSFVTSWFLGGA